MKDQSNGDFVGQLIAVKSAFFRVRRFPEVIIPVVP